MIAHTKPIEGPMPQTPEWNALRLYDPDREDRPLVFGASEAAIACGVSPYEQPLELYLIKRGEMQREFTPEQQQRMEEGLFFEPAIIRCYEKRTGWAVQRDLPMYFDPVHPWMAATPDGIVPGKDGLFAGGDTVVESKQTNFRMFDGDDENKFGEEGTDEIPVSYLCPGAAANGGTAVRDCRCSRLCQRYEGLPCPPE